MQTPSFVFTLCCSIYFFDGVKEDLNKDQVTALMDTIISNNIFLTKNGTLIKKSGAQLTRKAFTKFELA